MVGLMQSTLFDPKEMDKIQRVTNEKTTILDEIRAMEEKKHGPDWWKNELPKKKKKRSKKRRKKR